MTQTATNKMTPTESSSLTNCQIQIRESVELLSRTLEQPIPADQRESLEADICLASRSAYFDFYTWIVLHGEIDKSAETELDQLFQRALALLQPGRFLDSVRERYKEFRTKCQHVRSGFSTVSSMSSHRVQ